jgi:septum formation protein
VAVVKAGLSKAVVVSTDVEFKVLSATEIKNYWLTGEPQDKAGSYGIQGLAGQFVKQISGSYSAVVGLPLYETAQLLAEFGLVTSLGQPFKQ